MSDTHDLILRVHEFALASIKFYQRLPRTTDTQVPGVQYLKSSTAVESNYRAAKRGRSRAEFIAKLGTVVEEIDESVGWLELMRDARIASDAALLSEAQQLRTILGKSLGTARQNNNATKNFRTKN
jgi:four helix bundle protein